MPSLSLHRTVIVLAASALAAFAASFAAPFAAPCAAWAAEAAAEVALAPAVAVVEMRAYGMGLLPIEGKFTRFHGVARYDPSQPHKCQIMLEIDPSSLEMSNAAIRDRVIGPDFIDVARFPTMAFDGACADQSVTGNQSVTGTLSLHGQTHSLVFAVERADGRLHATGDLHRDLWGMVNDPILVGHTIRIRVDLPLPDAGTITRVHAAGETP